MKNLFALLTILFVSSSSFTQSEIDFITENTNSLNINTSKNHIFAYPVGDVNWSLDSVMTYLGEDRLSERYYIKAKDENGNMTSALTFHFYSIGTEVKWIKEDTITANYYDNESMREYLVRRWDIQTKILADTSQYVKYNKEGMIVEHIDAYSYSNIKSKKLYTFNNKGLLIKYLSQKHEYEYDNDWVNDEKRFITYNSNGDVTEDITQEWSEWEMKWINEKKYVNTYDNNNNLIKDETINWDKDSESWKNYQRYIYTYDNNNFKIEFSNERWNSNNEEWDVKYHGYFTNDGKNIVTSLIEIWQDSESKFENFWQYNYSFDDNNNQIEYFSQKWDPNSSTWINNKKEINAYDNFQNKILSQNQNWDDSSEKWINTTKSTWNYNDNNSKTLFLKQNWNNSIEEWINDRKDVYTYDTNNLLMNEDNQKWNTSIDEWEYRYRIFHFWSEFIPSSTFDSNINSIIISPNPCSNTMEILNIKNQSVSKIKVYSVSGKLVKVIGNNSNSVIDISHLQNGIYYIYIENKEGNFIKKIIKN